MTDIKFPDPPQALLGESPDAMDQRLQHLERALREALDVAHDHLGDDGARALWAEIGAGIRRKKGRPARSSGPERDAKLLDEYDWQAAQAPEGERGRVPAEVARLLNGKIPGHFGNGVEAIEKKLRRLLRKRSERQEKHDREMKVLSDRFWGGREPPPSMMEAERDRN